MTAGHALTRYYNCVVRVANNNATLSISNVDNCYNVIFKGALDYYGIKQQQLKNGNLTDSNKVSEKSNDNHITEAQAKVQDKSHVKSYLSDIFR